MLSAARKDLSSVLRFDRRMAEQELEDGEFRPDQEMDPYFLSSIDERVDKLMGEFGKKIGKMNRRTVFNQYDSFVCDPLLPPKPPKLTVSSVLDDMIAAVEYEPQSRDHQFLLRDYVSSSPKLAEVPLNSEGPQGTDMLSAGFSKDNSSSHQCSRFTLPWTNLSTKFVSHSSSRAPADKIPKIACKSEESQVKEIRSVGFSKKNPSAHSFSRSAMAGTMHPLNPVISNNHSRAKICKVAEDLKCINGNGEPSAGSLKENVPPTVWPLTMAKVAHISEGNQTRARQSVGSSKDNPGVHHCLPKTRHCPKPTHSFSRETYYNNNKAKVARHSEGIQFKDRPSVGFSKENLSARQSSPTLQPQARYPLNPLIQNFARAPDDKIDEVAHSSKGIQGKDRQSLDFVKENPSADQDSPTNWPQARHPLKPVSHNVSRSPKNKIGEVSYKSEGNQAKDRKSVGIVKENPSARQLYPTARSPSKLVSRNVSRTPDNKIKKDVLQGMQANNMPSMGSSKENSSAHGSSSTMMPQKRQPLKPLTQNITTVRGSKIVKVAHKPEGTSAMGRQSASFSEENPSASQCSLTTWPQARQPSNLSHNVSRSPIDKIDEVPHDSKGIQDKVRPYTGSLKENVSVCQFSPTSRLQTECPPKPQSFNRASDNNFDKVAPQGMKSNDIASTGSLKEKPRLHLSMSSKEKNLCQTSSGLLLSESKTLKPLNKSCVSLGKELGKDAKLENENPKRKLSGVTEAPASYAVAKEDSTDEWVGCDICYKWRLLPYGTNTAGLPDKWNCKMQTWLPGLNKCSISEEESGKAFRNLYPITVFESGSNLNSHHDSAASQIRSEKADCATKKQKLRIWGKSQAGQLREKKFKFIDEIYNSHDGIAASDTGNSQIADCASKKQKVSNREDSQAGQHAGNEKFKFADESVESHEIAASDIGKSKKVDCANKKQKVGNWEESQAGQHAGNKKIKITDESCGSYLRRQKKVAFSSPSKILKTEKLAGRKRRINEVVVNQKFADDDVDCASDLCGIKKKVSFLENGYLDTLNAVGQKKLGNFDSLIGQEGHQKESDNDQNMAHLCGTGHPTTDVGDVRCTIRKCNNSATIHVLKAATHLKDTAQRLEDKGLRIESTCLYFESALKYLHAASLLEPLGHDDIRCEDAIESIRYYAETSRICKSCALEFERCEKLAVAALAYKCMEVAHFKVAFIQHSITSKDQKELQATFKMVNPGVSSSSFDSGDDCIKTPVWLDPSAMAKDASSPKTVDNPVITAVSCPTYTRWLENRIAATQLSWAMSDCTTTQPSCSGEDDRPYGLRKVTRESLLLNPSLNNVDLMEDMDTLDSELSDSKYELEHAMADEDLIESAKRLSKRRHKSMAHAVKPKLEVVEDIKSQIESEQANANSEKPEPSVCCSCSQVSTCKTKKCEQANVREFFFFCFNNSILLYYDIF